MNGRHWRYRVGGLVPCLLVAAMLSGARPAMAYWVFFSPEEVLQVAFSEQETVTPVDWRLMKGGVKKQIEQEIGRALLFRRIKCFQGSRDGQVLSYACIDNEIGRSRPMTYMLKIAHPEGAIAHYEMMVFREQIIVYSESGVLPAGALDELVTNAVALDMDEVREQIAAQNQSEDKPA